MMTEHVSPFPGLRAAQVRGPFARLAAITARLRQWIPDLALRANPGNGGWVVALALFLFAAPAQAQDAPLLHAMFQDHAVLQRDQPIAVWGTAPANAQLTVTLGERSVRARAGRDGAWRASFPRMSEGGPYELRVSTRGAEQVVRDVMVGDVFLCSGQSNMAWPVSLSLFPIQEMANATDANIRLMQIAQTSAPTPQRNFLTPVRWQVGSPESVRDFSAVCYFFARELRRSGVTAPIGLINSSWGGTNIRSWMSAPALRQVGGYDEQLDLLDALAVDAPSATARWGDTWQAWWRANAQGEPWMPQSGANWAQAPATLDVFTSWGVPELANYAGMVWHRSSFTLTAEQAAQAGELSLGVIDEVDQTWLNGRLVGATGDWSAQRRYAVPRGALREGENVVVVNVLNSSGQGGMRGPLDTIALNLADGQSVPLRGWRYQAATGVPWGQAPRAPWEALGGLTSIGNAMIAPMQGYGLRGALWYQGESNTGAPGDYQALMSGLMADWRTRFNDAELPVLVVQLPNFGARPTAPNDSGWAAVREAQRRAVAGDAHAGLAVTIDAGDANDLHPPNKQEIARRLARVARSVVYGQTLIESGPKPVSARRAGDDIVITFGEIERGLVAYGAPGPVGFELCGAAAGSCRYASARMDDTRVRLSADHPSATRVRYCWADAPTCTLYDSAGAPAGPFEIQIQ